MLIYAGIDEAGYGPMLGPLAIACTVFAVDEHDESAGAPNLWRRLAGAVCRSRSDRKRRIAIEDSKKLKGAKDAPTHPLRHLERGVLAFAGACGIGVPESDQDLFAGVKASLPAAPWYGSPTVLPAAQTRDELRIAAKLLERALAAAGVRCELIRAELIDGAQFNSQVEVMGSKASINFCAVLRLLDMVWSRWPDNHPRIVIDRQGGRTHYLRALQQCYPDAKFQILDEDQTISRYRLDRDGSLLTVTFVTEAETQHLPVALASMTGKYLRELLMLRMNRYFSGLMPELKPTAGYVQDARRFLTDIEPLVQRLGLDRTQLVRCV